MKKLVSLFLIFILLLSLSIPVVAASDDEAAIQGEYPFEISQECAKAYLSILHQLRSGYGEPFRDGEWGGYPIFYGCCGGFLANLGGVDHEPELVLAASYVNEIAYAPYSELLVYTWDGTKAILADQIAVLASGNGRSWPSYMLRQTTTGNILQETWNFLDGPPEQRYLSVRFMDGQATLEDVGAIVSEKDSVWTLAEYDYILFQNYETLDGILTAAASTTPKESEGGEPSDWAKSEVTGAVSKGLVPDALRSAYQSPITREEFCCLVMQTLSQAFGLDMTESLAQRDELEYGVFTDTTRAEILAAHHLGIVNGRGNGIFDPNNTITRQEAACMLTRAARDSLHLTAKKGITFSDSGQFASWATDSIDFISGLIDPFNGFKVMGGTGNNLFSPFGSYTHEQAICTMLRMYENWEMKNTAPDEYETMIDQWS